MEVRICVYVHGVSGLAPAIWYSNAIFCVMGFGLAPAITDGRVSTCGGQLPSGAK